MMTKAPISSRSSSKKEPLVSVIYTTYNHERYVENALDSFLKQKTDFEYEIIAHDDCSLDSTDEILKRYQTENPHIVETIFQTENQFSYGTKPVTYWAMQKARGQYIAFCDGDDYWISEDKLQLQVEAMRKFSVDMSGHPASCVNEDGTATDRKSGFFTEETAKFTPTDLVKNHCNMLPMSSVMITDRVKSDMLNNMPPIKYHTGIQLLGARYTGLCVLPKVMSAYRLGVEGSATQLLLSSEDLKLDTAVDRLKGLNRIFKLYDEEALAVEARRALKAFIYAELNEIWKADKRRLFEALSDLDSFTKREKAGFFPWSLRKSRRRANV